MRHHDRKQMTEDDAVIWIDFLMNRLFGWDIAMSIDPATGWRDRRTRRSREAGELQRDIIFNTPPFETFLRSVVCGIDPVSLWPEEMQPTIRFRFDHKVPRERNEPTSETYRAEKREHQGMDWPDFVVGHGKLASVDDHPPFPPRSEHYRAWKADIAAGFDSHAVISRGLARKHGLPPLAVVS